MKSKQSFRFLLTIFFILILVMSTAGCQSRSNSKTSENNASGTITDISQLAHGKIGVWDASISEKKTRELLPDEPIRDFFGSEQLTIFTRALDMLNIYEDSKTYIVDAELEDVVAKMRTIVRMAKPYKEIPKLPELREKFMNCYMRILEEQAEPVKDSINQDRNRVFEVLNTKSYKDAKFNRYLDLFKEIMDGAEHCNNVSTLRSYADKAEALKLRLLNEMNAEDIRLVQEAAAKAEAERKRQEEEAKKRGETVKPEEKVAEAQPVYKVRTTKNVSIKTVAKTASWRLESKDDVDKYLAALRENLLKEMDEDTIVNIEL